MRMLTLTFRHAPRIAFALLGVLLVGNTQADNDSLAAQLQMLPEQCIAHTQGQTCYQTIVANWQVPKAGNYCLYDDSQSEALACWQNRKSGKATILFESNQSVRFELRAKDSPRKKALAQAEITVTWVYRKNKLKRSTWRLF